VTCVCYRALGIVIVEDEEGAWFPGDELAEFHGLARHHVTRTEAILFGFREDGREGICCPTGGPADEEDEDEDT
jgi:solute carrier family 6 amino acid/orphan transporter-like 15/16/17/18/20